MAIIGGLLLLLGYNNLYWGLDQIGGGNNGWFSLLIPGKFTNQPNDKPGSGSSSQVSGKIGATPTTKLKTGATIFTPTPTGGTIAQQYKQYLKATGGG